ncbi:sigma-54-dependent Fis family transcriptional regulator [Porphyromonas sp.]|uniref:sigma-54 interaction domain-containing protein n=1 Tax=Porphyromonas sp. TaxID=1924944 RepID=UPI0026DAD4EC|nr:sigma-54 dependent transcriptional regulator [Porphyromonas sp.]MDO4770758.1 sigma-54 dependent transcriptional regulator [Porphyromonas sp.]
MNVSNEIIKAKQRFGIIGNAPSLNRAIEVALLIAPTDVSALITGESGVGKESFPQIIHSNSIRKHGPYITVNCGAIPEGTIDSELFGHKKGSFTDAVSERKGYFEVADGGTIFLDEVGELPLPTQARLLRVLESGEFMKVGSSQVQRTNIRVVAATNVDLQDAIRRKKFREDLYYRLNTVTIELPPLRDRGEDIRLLFRKFAADFADKYRMPPVRLSDEAQMLISTYNWPGNIRQLRNVVERLSVIAEDREISIDILRENLPANAEVRHPAIIRTPQKEGGFRDYESSSKEIPTGSLEILYKMIYDLKNEVSELSRNLHRAMDNHPSRHDINSTPAPYVESAARPLPQTIVTPVSDRTSFVEAIPRDVSTHQIQHSISGDLITSEYEEILNPDRTLSLEEMEQEYIRMVLRRNNGVRKKTADDLKISERTLYRKLKEHDLD